jgi:hypothetical protein
MYTNDKTHSTTPTLIFEMNLTSLGRTYNNHPLTVYVQVDR